MLRVLTGLRLCDQQKEKREQTPSQRMMDQSTGLGNRRLHKQLTKHSLQVIRPKRQAVIVFVAYLNHKEVLENFKEEYIHCDIALLMGISFSYVCVYTKQKHTKLYW